MEVDDYGRIVATRKVTVAHRASGWLVTLERVLLHALSHFVGSISVFKND